MTDAIISIKPRHVENILSGKKTVELRVRSVNLPVGTRMWVYTTLPVGSVSVSVDVDFIESLPPKEMWRKYGHRICISKKEFDDYTKCRDFVTAIGLREIRRLDSEVSLETMRVNVRGFQPPQFFSRVSPGSELYKVFYG